MKHNRGFIYDKVNKAETFEELSIAILGCADDDGNIQGRERKFDAAEMAQRCVQFKELNQPNLLTREYGIRQQAIYLERYDRP
jgi:hypothetical protein